MRTRHAVKTSVLTKFPHNDADASLNRPPVSLLVSDRNALRLEGEEDVIAHVKIRSSIDGDVWKDLKALALESDRGLSELLTEAIREYCRRWRYETRVAPRAGDPASSDNAATGGERNDRHQIK